ncbi:MAG: DUF3108 domain-containing protein [Porticoccaceae bacterium]|nr:DUF3108 domain-containing protein [Porticoccaceae bacterium]
MRIAPVIAAICLFTSNTSESQMPTASSLSAPVVAPAIAEMTATYAANYNGISITAVKTIIANVDGEYIDRLDATSLFGKITQAARYKISANGQLLPLEYNDRRSMLGIKRSEEQVFDWDLLQLQYRKGKHSAQLAIEPGTLDIPTHQLQLRRDLAAGRSEFKYPVVARGKHQLYRYSSIRKEQLETPIGKLDTIVMQRQRNNGARKTTLWLAPRWDYLLVKLEQIEKKEHYTMVVEDAVINGRKVIPKSASIEVTP